MRDGDRRRRLAEAPRDEIPHADDRRGDAGALAAPCAWRRGRHRAPSGARVLARPRRGRRAQKPATRRAAGSNAACGEWPALDRLDHATIDAGSRSGFPPPARRRAPSRAVARHRRTAPPAFARDPARRARRPRRPPRRAVHRRRRNWRPAARAGSRRRAWRARSDFGHRRAPGICRRTPPRRGDRTGRVRRSCRRCRQPFRRPAAPLPSATRNRGRGRRAARRCGRRAWGGAARSASRDRGRCAPESRAPRRRRSPRLRASRRRSTPAAGGAARG